MICLDIVSQYFVIFDLKTNMMDNFFVCNVAVAPLRKEANNQAEMVSQLLFGDRVTVLEKAEKWCLIKTRHDGCKGWMDPKQLGKIDPLFFNNENQYQLLASLQPVNELIGEDGSKYYLTPGSSLPFCNQEGCLIGNKFFKLNFLPIKPQHNQFLNKVAETATFFLNAPYLWGGRTIFGIDCSGFSQMVYKILGFVIKRDAWQQAEQGTPVDFISEAQTGDLAFFDNDFGKIIHVGLMLGNDKIIHASGKVRIDLIDNQGIYNAEIGRYTHQLRMIKRLV